VPTATIAVVKSSRVSRKSKRERVKALPWALLLQSAVVIGRRWRALSDKDRARIATLARSSQGRLGKLSAKERAELRALAGKLNIKAIGFELAGIARGGRARRKRRRGRCA
jgi:hypothetical protein